MILFPYKTDSPVQKVPYINIAVSLLLLAASLMFYYGKLDLFFIDIVMAAKWSPLKAAGSFLLQPDLISTLSVLLIIFFLGNALNSSIGNTRYAIVLFALIALSSFVHQITSYIPPIGAHGVITGLASLNLMILPSNKLLLFKPDLEEETGVRIITLIIIWFLFDLYSIIEYSSIVSIITQISCFAFGIIAAIIIIKTGFTGTATFVEWLNDIMSGITNSESLADNLRLGRKKTGEAEVKSKAEKLLGLYEFKIDDESGEFNEPEILPAQIETEAEIKFRALKGVKQKESLTVYFVYEGKNISEISVYSEFSKCEIYPQHELRRGDSGSIKFFAKNYETSDKIYIIIKYKIDSTEKKKELSYSISKNEIVCRLN